MISYGEFVEQMRANLNLWLKIEIYFQRLFVSERPCKAL
jgi:hypothetical protein